MQQGSAGRVCMDGRMLGPGGTGVSTYARALQAALPVAGITPLVLTETPTQLDVRGWPKLARAHRWIDAARPGARTARLDPDDPTRLSAPALFRIAQLYFNAHRRLLPVRVAAAPGIMHWTYPVPLRMEGWINVYTVHDAIPLAATGLSPVNLVRHARLLDRIAESADAICTVSAAARAEILAITGWRDAFVTDCSQAVLPMAPTPTLPAGIARGAYFLFCGSIEPRKNVEALVAAYRASGATIPLLLAGPDGWQADRITARIGVGTDVRRLDYLSKDALAGLIAGARALLFPSLAEGFGLPVAEAMTLGTPVMTSATGALAETAGDAALLVDPADIARMADAIARLTVDDALCGNLRKRGLDRARAFTVDRFAARLASFYATLTAPQQER
jgi:glycosyltransferase involved in cell wall biosynthesis